MTYLVILAALALVPVVLITLLRVNGAIAFMSLCLGSVLVRYTVSDVSSIASGLSSKISPGLNQWASLVLLVLPFVVTILFTRKSVAGNKQLTNFLPAIASGLLFALLVTPLLGGSLQIHIEGQPLWRTLSDLQTGVLLGGAFFSLVFILFTHRGHHDGGDKKHGH